MKSEIQIYKCDDILDNTYSVSCKNISFQKKKIWLLFSHSVVLARDAGVQVSQKPK